jgi:hypothetical protein
MPINVRKPQRDRNVFSMVPIIAAHGAPPFNDYVHGPKMKRDAGDVH